MGGSGEGRDRYMGRGWGRDKGKDRGRDNDGDNDRENDRDRAICRDSDMKRDKDKKESLFCLAMPPERIDFHIISYWTSSIW